MKKYHCSCSHHAVLFFESIQCTVCNRLTGYCDITEQVLAFDPGPEPGQFVSSINPQHLYRQCQNYKEHQACNGMIRIDRSRPIEQQPVFCFACHFNQIIPDLSISGNVTLWQKLETAKRRTLFTMKALRLNLLDNNQDPENGLSFYFLTDKDASNHFMSPAQGQNRVLTGHENGKITVNLAEADDVARTLAKQNMGEQYRTLLGHFRHEAGHFIWEQLIGHDPDRLNLFRKVFGDETQDYQTALNRYYQGERPADWEQTFVSAYASMHPWEDWAETWAHYLHILDTLETAQHFGIDIDECNGSNAAHPGQEPDIPQLQIFSENMDDMESVLDAWIRLSVVINALNRSMGLQDAYPFVLYPAIREKLKLVHALVHKAT